jgi:hypothetical protein
MLWKTDVDDFPVGRISGSPTLYNGRIYVGTASAKKHPVPTPHTNAASSAAASLR